MKVVVDQSSEAEEINASVHHGSILGTSLFLFFFFIKSLPRNIIRSLVNVDANDTTDYERFLSKSRGVEYGS